MFHEALETARDAGVTLSRLREVSERCFCGGTEERWSARPDAPCAEPHEGLDAAKPEPHEGPDAAWISLNRPLEETGPAPAGPVSSRGLRRILPKRPGFFLLVVVTGIAAYVVNTKGCCF